MNRENEIILDVQNLKKYFPIRGGLITRTVGHVKAVDGISFKLFPPKSGLHFSYASFLSSFIFIYSSPL